MARETCVQSQIESYQILKKMVLDATLINIQHYKVRIKGKVEQSRERSSTLSLHLGVPAIEKGALGSPSTTVANFTFTYYIYIYICVCVCVRLCMKRLSKREREGKKKEKGRKHLQHQDISIYLFPLTL